MGNMYDNYVDLMLKRKDEANNNKSTDLKRQQATSSSTIKH